MKLFISLIGLTALVATAAFAAQSKDSTGNSTGHHEVNTVTTTSSDSNSNKSKDEEYRIMSKYWYMERPQHGGSRD